MNAVTGSAQNPKSRPCVVRFKVAIKGVHKQDQGLFSSQQVLRRHPGRALVEKMLGLPSRPAAPGRQAGQKLGPAGQYRQAVTQVQQARKASCKGRIKRQVSDQTVFEGVAMPRLVVVEGFDLHARHVNAGGAIASAAFAAHAQVHRLHQGRTGQPLVIKLAAERKAQGVGPAPGQVLLVPGDPVAWAHGPGVEVSTSAVVVAHVHGFGKALCRVATSAGAADFLGERVVLDIPGAPVQGSLNRDHLVSRAITHQRALVHGGRVDDALG